MGLKRQLLKGDIAPKQRTEDRLRERDIPGNRMERLLRMQPGVELHSNQGEDE